MLCFCISITYLVCVCVRVRVYNIEQFVFDIVLLNLFAHGMSGIINSIFCIHRINEYTLSVYVIALLVYIHFSFYFKMYDIEDI